MSKTPPPEHNISKVGCIETNVAKIVKDLDPDEAFWIGDLDRPRESIALWEEHMPSVKMYYAMKCCDEPHLLRFLADHGLGFDCASQVEIQQILDLGVDPARIVFSHPLKSAAALRYAKEKGVDRLVFDCEEELRKILKYHPTAEVFLRVKPKFTNALIQLSNKFGAEPKEVPTLLQLAKELGAGFIGFSFHVGSLCDDLETFRSAFSQVSDLQKEAAKAGLSVCFVDIGGGFLPPNAPAKFKFPTVAKEIEQAVEEFFAEQDIEFIAEPGRFIGSEYLDLHVPVISVKIQVDDEGAERQSVYIPDGMYGAFNALSYDHAKPHFELFSNSISGEHIPTTLWGQTCDSADCIYENMSWPKLKVGDILTVRKFGAYTYSPTSFFNGFGHHKVFIMNEEEEEEP